MKRAAGKAVRRSAILDAALECFSQHGFSGASMEAIAAASGLSKPTLYSYFSSKEALFAAVMDAKLAQMRKALDAPEEAGMVATLHRFAWAYAREVMRPDMLSLARVIIGEAQRFPEIGRRYQSSGPDLLLDALMTRLGQYRDTGDLAFASAEDAAQDFWGLILSAPRTKALHDPTWTPTEAELTHAITNGLSVFFKAYACEPDIALTHLAVCSPSSVQKYRGLGSGEAEPPPISPISAS